MCLAAEGGPGCGSLGLSGLLIFMALRCCSNITTWPGRTWVFLQNGRRQDYCECCTDPNGPRRLLRVSKSACRNFKSNHAALVLWAGHFSCLSVGRGADRLTQRKEDPNGPSSSPPPSCSLHHQQITMSALWRKVERK